MCVVVLQSTNEAVFAVEFNPSDSGIIITCGKSHVHFWTLSAGSLTKKQGIFGVSGLLQDTDPLCSNDRPTPPMLLWRLLWNA